MTSFRALPVEAQRTQNQRLSAAVERYSGEFLSGLQVADALEFDEWRVLTQEQLRRTGDDNAYPVATTLCRTSRLDRTGGDGRHAVNWPWFPRRRMPIAT